MTAAKRISVALAIAAAPAIAGCDEDGESTEGPSAETEPTAAQTEADEPTGDVEEADGAESILARIGGSTAAVGSLFVELLPHANNEIHALVMKQDGSVDNTATLKLAVQASDGQSHDVELAWDESEARYVGKLEGEATLVPGAVGVTVEVEGDEQTVEVPSVAIAPTPTYGGRVMVAGPVAAEIVAQPAGGISAVAIGPEGTLTGDAGASLEVDVRGSDSEMHTVALAWDADAATWEGEVGGDVQIAPGPLVFRAVVGGETQVARIVDVGVVAPSHEGDIVAVGDMNVELVPQGTDGTLHAFVTGPTGAAIEEGAEITLKVQPEAEPVTLQWDAGVRCYVGVVAPSVDISTAPIQLAVVHDGRRRHGGLAVAAGRRLGVDWRARVESGAGGAIPPGQARRLAAGLEVPGGGVEVGARARGAAMAGLERAQAGAAMVSVMGGAMVQAPSVEVERPDVRARAEAARMEAAMVSAGVMGGVSTMGGVGLMVGGN